MGVLLAKSLGNGGTEGTLITIELPYPVAVPDLELREEGGWSILGLALPACLPFAIFLFPKIRGVGPLPELDPPLVAS